MARELTVTTVTAIVLLLALYRAVFADTQGKSF